MFGEMINTEIDALLKKQLVGHIGCHANGMTYVVAISYVYDGNDIYAHTFKGMKIDIMRINPKVCLTGFSSVSSSCKKQGVLKKRMADISLLPDNCYS